MQSLGSDFRSSDYPHLTLPLSTTTPSNPDLAMFNLKGFHSTPEVSFYPLAEVNPWSGTTTTNPDFLGLQKVTVGQTVADMRALDPRADSGRDRDRNRIMPTLLSFYDDHEESEIISMSRGVRHPLHDVDSDKVMADGLMLDGLNRAQFHSDPGNSFGSPVRVSGRDPVIGNLVTHPKTGGTRLAYLQTGGIRLGQDTAQNGGSVRGSPSHRKDDDLDLEGYDLRRRSSQRNSDSRGMFACDVLDPNPACGVAEGTPRQYH